MTQEPPQSPRSRHYMERQEKVYAWLLLDWLENPNRKSAAIAFTEGALRSIGYAVEDVLAAHVKTDVQRDALRYRALIRDQAYRSTTSPVVVDQLGAPDAGQNVYTAIALENYADRLVLRYWGDVVYYAPKEEVTPHGDKDV